jgi:small conductance mechanosensitive channel
VDMQAYIDSARVWLLGYGPRALGALVILLVGWTVARAIRGALQRGLLRAQFDETLAVFLSRLAYILLLAVVVIVTIQKLGVDTTPFAAVVAAAGLAIGLALQGSLSNFASGIMLIAGRPFQVGHVIEAAGAAGTVEAIGVFATELSTPDNKRVFVPNSAITKGTITNYSSKETRRIDLIIRAGYDSDIRKAKKLLEGVLAEDARVLKEPAPTVAVGALGESSVEFVVRPWVKTADYWDVTFDLNERIKIRLYEAGTRVPYPHREVFVHNVGERNPA